MSDTLPSIRSRLEALADWLTEHVKTLPTETRVWPNKLAGYIDTLRTVGALLAEPGEEEADSKAMRAAADDLVQSGKRPKVLSHHTAFTYAQLLRRQADTIERLTVRLEAEKRRCAELENDLDSARDFGDGMFTEV